jgi:hypothetical protein
VSGALNFKGSRFTRGLKVLAKRISNRHCNIGPSEKCTASGAVLEKPPRKKKAFSKKRFQ